MTTYRLSLLVIAPSVCIGVAAGVARSDDKTTAAQVLLSGYLDEVNTRANSPAPRADEAQWLRDWLSRFTDVVFDVPDRSLQKAIASAALGHANALEEYDTSERLLNLLARIGDTPAEKAAAVAELGGLKAKRSATSESSVATAGASKEAFEKTIELLSYRDSTGRIPPESYDRIVRTYSDLGHLFLRQPATQDARQAADYFQRGRNEVRALAKLATERPSATKAARPVHGHADEEKMAATYASVHTALSAEGYTVENFAAYELEAVSKAPDDARAVALLTELAGLPNIRVPITTYILGYSARAHGLHTGPYHQFLRQWLTVAPLDHAALVVRFHYAESFLITKQFADGAEASRPAYAPDAVAIFRQSEPEAFANRRGGTLSDVLYIAAQCNANNDNLEEGAAVSSMFLDLFPEDPRCDYMHSLLNTRAKSLHLLESSFARDSRRKTILLASTAVLLTLGAGYTLVRLRNRPRSAPGRA